MAWAERVCCLRQAVIKSVAHATNGHAPGDARIGGKLGSLAGRRMAQFVQLTGSNYDEVAAQVLAQARPPSACSDTIMHIEACLLAARALHASSCLV